MDQRRKDPERIAKQPETIAPLLHRYIEAHNENGRYEILQSIMNDNHEVAWIRYSGETFQGTPFEDVRLYCACYFTENVGWKIDEKHGSVGLIGGESCERMSAVVELRIQELSREYAEKYPDIRASIADFFADLIQRDKNSEFIGEGTAGAHFWGGHFYLQTAQQISGIPFPEFWEYVDTLVREKKIQFEGMVVQEYTEPPEPRWGVYFEREFEGFSIRALLPVHSRMSQIWKYDVVNSTGEVLSEDLTGIPGARLNYSPDFGVDQEDLAVADQEMKKLAEQIMNERS